MKEFTVFPPQKKKVKKEKKDEDILLLLKEDGIFVQYGDSATISKSSQNQNEVLQGVEAMKGHWDFVDGKLILAADRAEDLSNIRAEGKTVDTILTGEVQATSGEGLVENPALLKIQKDQKSQSNDGSVGAASSSSSSEANAPSVKSEDLSPILPAVRVGDNEDVHLKVSGEIAVGKFFYPQDHPNFFEQPIFGPTPTGTFELQQVLGALNTQTDDDSNKLVEKFKKVDLMNKKYFLTSYPIQKRQKKQRWSIKYNSYVDNKPKSKAEKEWEEQEKNAPMPIKSFEVELFANNTFSTITGLGDTVLRGKWSIVGEDRDHLWMSVWRFGFGRSVSGSTFSEGTHLSEKDDVSYWGEIYEVDAAAAEDSIEDIPCDWRGTKIEINGAVMMGVGLEPCSVAQFTMIEKTEENGPYDDDEEDDDDDDDDFPTLGDDIGSFE